MSQIIVPTSSNDVLLLNMIDDGTTTASGSSYVLPAGDDTVFDVIGVRGNSITVDAANDTKINLKKGLYQINFSGWVQTTGVVTGSVDYQLKVSTSPTFAFADVIFDRLLLSYDGVNPVLDPSHTTLFNAASDTTIYIQITLSNGSSLTWYLRSDETIAGSTPTNIQIQRIGDAV